MAVATVFIQSPTLDDLHKFTKEDLVARIEFEDAKLDTYRRKFEKDEKETYFANRVEVFFVS